MSWRLFPVSICFILLLEHVSTTSLTFSYRTCLSQLNLVHLEHRQNEQRQYFSLRIENFDFHLVHRYQNQTSAFHFGPQKNFFRKNISNFDDQYRTAIQFYQSIDRWNYVNITFDDRSSHVFVSFNADEKRLIPLISYPWSYLNQTVDSILDVVIDVEAYDRNVSCFLPHTGFPARMINDWTPCMMNMKLCERRICTSTNRAIEQYCPLFQIFDCYPFTDVSCGSRSIPVLCSNENCFNGGSCSIDLIQNRSRCICPLGFAGEDCQYSIDECQSSPCPHHSKCLDQPNGYKCICDEGWTGSDCSLDIDECQTTKPCQAARTCINQPGSYQCECLENFVGHNCEMIRDPCLSDPCQNNATKCHSILDRDQIRYHCTCQSGFTGINCETNINDCEGIICPKNNTQCIDGVNSFHCECKTHFKRNWDGTCVEQNPCDSSPCHQNATCYNLNGGQYRCICPATYTGTQCDEDIDECTVFPFICRNGGTCVNELGSYRCYCSNGWTGPTCAKTVDHCVSQPCHRNGTCINKINGFECRCSTSYTGHVCQLDIDECLINPCLNNGTCHNYVGGFHCQCSNGYFGFHCEYPPAECERLQQASFSIQCTDPHLCLVNNTENIRQINQLSTHTCKTERDRILDQYFICLDQQNHDHCHCPSDFLPCTDNYTQTLSKALHSKLSCPCENGASCFRQNVSHYRCYCPSGFTGEKCEISIDACMSRPCYNHGTCISKIDNFTCHCPSTHQGLFCQTLRDPCTNHSCLNNGTCQRSKNNDYDCRCSSTLYTGQYCEIYQSPCSSSPCQNRGTCHDIQETFHCQCPPNYQGQLCQDKIDRCSQHICFNGASCLEHNGTIQCTCLPGFTGFFCERNIDECYAQPCSIHGQCIDLINGYQCRCQSGWIGFHCELKQAEISKSFNYRPNLITVFHLRHSSINISKSLPRRHSPLPIRIQYEFRTTVKQAALLSIGSRFKQTLNQDRILTNLDNKTLMSTYSNSHEHWLMISVEVFHSWIDVRIGKNALSQRFYISNQSFADLIHKQIQFGDNNDYSGCVRNIEITYSQAYSILLTDQLIETNENRTLGCERTNACDLAVCRVHEVCVDHWFYHTCRCEKPFFGEQCDQIAPIVAFDHRSWANLSTTSSIANISLFLNTLESNGTLFELVSSIANERSISLPNRTDSKVLAALIDGRLRLVIVDDGPKRQEFELRSEQTLNDGRPHHIQLDLRNSWLTIDHHQNETLTKLPDAFVPNQMKFFDDEPPLDGWFQDLRINDQMVLLNNSYQSAADIRIDSANMNVSTTNPCHPVNPCLNGAKCLVNIIQDYVCECEENWFGRNCSEVNICDYNKTTLCPSGFICKTTGDSQECLATATFTGNTSSLIASLNSAILQDISNEFSFRLRARTQRAHLLTIKNLYTSNYFSLYLFDRNLIYRDSILTTDLLIELNNETFEEWTTFHFYWSEFSTLTINHLHTYTINLSLKSLVTSIGQTQIFIGNGFRGCLEYMLMGENAFLPFYDDRYERFRLRTKKFSIEQYENIQINNCTFDDICTRIDCGHGQCIQDFDQGKCLCQIGWTGEFCQVNIDECQQGNNCSKLNSVCEDHPDGFYTCQCHTGFTGRFCETNIDDCESSPCVNNGTCIDLTNEYRCECSQGYIDRHCSVSINETCFGSNAKCQNNGTCQLISENLYVDHPKVECSCLPGFFGRWCEQDACLTLSCKNEGVCQRLPNGQARCQCNERWFGDLCQNDVNECDGNRTNPCSNNGTCINTLGGYQCQCSENHLGINCERKHTCLENSPCLNQGICRIQGEAFFCDCRANFTGPICQWMTCAAIPCDHNGTCFSDTERGFRCNCSGTGYEGEQCRSDINECLSNPCLNNGSCIDVIDGYSCSCIKGYLGSQCQLKALASSWQLSYHYVVWPILALFLLLMIILLSVILVRFRESRRSRGTYQPAINENGQSSRVEFSMILKPPPEERLI